MKNQRHSSPHSKRQTLNRQPKSARGMSDKKDVRKHGRFRRSNAEPETSGKMTRSVAIPGPASVDVVVRKCVLPNGSVVINPWCFMKSLLGAFPAFFMIDCDKTRSQPAVRTSSTKAHAEPIKMTPTAAEAIDLTSATVIAAEAAAQTAVIAVGIAEAATGAALATTGGEELLKPPAA